MSKRKEQDSTCMIPKVELKGGSVVGVTGSVLG